MFKKNYIGRHGYRTFVRGVFRRIDGELRVKVTATGRPDDEFSPGEVLSLAEIADRCDGDPFAYAEEAALCLVC